MRDAEKHFGELAELLELESKAEAEAVRDRAQRLSAADAEAGGSAIVDLAAKEERVGLGGRFLLELVKRKGARLPWTRLDVGTPVILSVTDAAPRASREVHRGVISRRDERAIEVALSESPEELDGGEDPTWRIDLAHDEATAARQREALRRVASAKGGRLAELRAVLLGEREPKFTELDDDIVPLDRTLNDSQLEAVRLALSAEDVALIHGPPGTGKTRTVVEVIRQAIKSGEKVLACAPSNMGADNMLERLVAANERVVRLGHPARVLPALVHRTLDLLVEEHDDVRLARKLVREAVALQRKAGKYSRARPVPGARAEMYRESRALFADARRLEDQAVERILDRADVVCATTSIDAELLRDRRFDLVVIDEACQSTEPGSWVPILRAAKRVVFAGDHRQLPPTIISKEAAARGLGVSLFERLVERFGDKVVRMLDVQYRMNEEIMELSSREMYGGALIAHESVARHVLADLEGVARTPSTERAVELIDSSGASWDEEIEPDGESRLNREEAQLVRARAIALVEAGVPPEGIAVIAPYAAQVRHIRRTFAETGDARLERIEVDTVDGFQGREKEAVIISLVRSNDGGEIGFLADERRMNVALTRARRKLIIVGDGATLSGHGFYARMFAYFEELGAYSTVWDDS